MRNERLYATSNASASKADERDGASDESHPRRSAIGTSTARNHLSADSISSASASTAMCVVTPSSSTLVSSSLATLALSMSSSSSLSASTNPNVDAAGASPNTAPRCKPGRVNMSRAVATAPSPAHALVDASVSVRNRPTSGVALHLDMLVSAAASPAFVNTSTPASADRTPLAATSSTRSLDAHSANNTRSTPSRVSSSLDVDSRRSSSTAASNARAASSPRTRNVRKYTSSYVTPSALVVVAVVVATSHTSARMERSRACGARPLSCVSTISYARATARRRAAATTASTSTSASRASRTNAPTSSVRSTNPRMSALALSTTASSSAPTDAARDIGAARAPRAHRSRIVLRARAAPRGVGRPASSTQA